MKLKTGYSKYNLEASSTLSPPLSQYYPVRIFVMAGTNILFAEIENL